MIHLSDISDVFGGGSCYYNVASIHTVGYCETQRSSVPVATAEVKEGVWQYNVELFISYICVCDQTSESF